MAKIPRPRQKPVIINVTIPTYHVVEYSAKWISELSSVFQEDLRERIADRYRLHSWQHSHTSSNNPIIVAIYTK